MAHSILAPAVRGDHVYHHAVSAFGRNAIIALTAFLTLVDLFATQAILPSLVKAYQVSPAAMSFAVNASTIGMAISGLTVGFLSPHINRRWGVFASLALLAIPTSLLAYAPGIGAFTVLRILQGLLMAAAFTLTLAYLAEQCSAEDTASAFAAYITGNVASNFFGRLLSAAVADHFGLAWNFYVFAGLNLAGAALVYFSLHRTRPTERNGQTLTPIAAVRAHLTNPPLCAAFAIGFCILFAFIGTFTYVNFVLVGAPFSVAPMALGLVYFVFLPSMLTTPAAGRAVARFGTRPTVWAGLLIALAALPLLLTRSLTLVLAGLTIVGVGTFFAQATATGFVGRAATTDRGSASGIYLACYFFGGNVGSLVLGQVFDGFGWPATAAGIGIALGVAVLLVFRLRLASADSAHLSKP